MTTRRTSTEERIKDAHRRGYRIRKDGKVIGLNGRILKVRTTGGTPYPKFNVAKPSQGSIPVHRFAGFQWFGEIVFRPDIQVRHLDGNPFNNSRDNLAFGTASENMLDRPEKDRAAIAKYAASHRRRLTEAQVAELRSMRDNGATLAELVKAFGIAKSTVSYIVNRRTYK